MNRRVTITADMIRAYSRRGNYHSDPETATKLGLPGLVAQGVQVAGPAYGALLDEWGEAFLANGEIELRFVAPVLAETTVEAHVAIDGDTATLHVDDVGSGVTTVVGTAHRTLP
jgi:acyl dehydratase